MEVKTKTIRILSLSTTNKIKHNEEGLGRLIGLKLRLFHSHFRLKTLERGLQIFISGLVCKNFPTLGFQIKKKIFFEG